MISCHVRSGAALNRSGKFYRVGNAGMSPSAVRQIQLSISGRDAIISPSAAS